MDKVTKFIARYLSSHLNNKVRVNNTFNVMTNPVSPTGVNNSVMISLFLFVV